MSEKWEKSNESPWSDIVGRDFYTLKNSTVIPYANFTLEDLHLAPKPLWITDIHPDNSLGNVVKEYDGTYWINLPNNFELYISTLEPKYQKKFLKNLNQNSDLVVKHNNLSDIDLCWSHYVDRINFLANKAGGSNYTEEELSFRYRYYTRQSVKYLSIYKEDTLLALNLSEWNQTTVFDLACMIIPSEQSLPRSLGTYAILKNIELSINSGMKIYDLLASNFGYKTTYGAKEYKLKSIVIAEDSFFDEYKIPKNLKFNLNE